ncbi:FMN-dependent NADH-azoreductase [Kribbella endophytica]
MPTLLHLDSSVFPGERSASRAVTDTFRQAWQEQHPDGTVVYRDLNAAPVPHITAEAYTAGLSDPSGHTPGQTAALAARLELIEELEQADAVLLGAPMYNYAIPSTLKTWLDSVMLPGRTSGENPSSQGTPIVVVASRGGSYRPGTPREDWEFVQNYLLKVLGESLGLDVEFIVPELTMAPKMPAMADLIPMYERSREQALEDAVVKAKALAERLAS